MRVRRVAAWLGPNAGVSASEMAQELAAGAWAAEARLMKSQGPSWVARARLMHRDCVIKVREAGGLVEALKRAVGGSRGHRHWRAALWLLRRDIATPAPVALATARQGGRLVEVLVTAYVPGRTLLRMLGEGGGDARAQLRVARAAGALVAEVLHGGRYNRDHKPSNVLLIAPRGGPHLASDGHQIAQKPALALLDPVGLRRVRAAEAAVTAAARMLASQVIEPTGVGCPPRGALRRAALRACLERRWELDAPPESQASPHEPMDVEWERVSARAYWRAVAQMVRAHGDPTPRVNPLDDA
ncbi:MAG: hypothetical protein C0468_06550 [Planctomyces sp.]|nr:hypothetical protein [Planctomyces sp.]